MATETILAMKNEITSLKCTAGASAAIEKSTEAGNMQFGRRVMQFLC